MTNAVFFPVSTYFLFKQEIGVGHIERQTKTVTIYVYIFIYTYIFTYFIIMYL